MKQQIIDEISIELEAMAIIVSEVESLIEEVSNNEPSNIQKTALGGFASHFYNGVENIFKRIHKYCNIELPQGDNWHIDLLKRFSKSSEFDLPIKLSDELIEKLNNYRRFRHYFFHGYGFNLNWEILSDGVKDIREVFSQFSQEVQDKLQKI
ncbi:MAG TPA: hypothetical protein PLV01_07890 [Candidatus Kapabacteria bacterium]|jgi:hypothetical protein|nr:hypothetical protein [Candidatus Kapabacteria bacterium]HPU23252.1 hypothetical protein [Candidatus Kapabacteria bacterium]